MAFSDGLRSVRRAIDAHQKEIRVGAFIVGAASAVATPFLAGKAKDNVSVVIEEKEAELGRKLTKKEKMEIYRKEPFVWFTAGTTALSLGCGALGYTVGNRIISQTTEALDKAVEDLSVQEEAIHDMPDKDRVKVEKKIVEKKAERAVKCERSKPGDGERGTGTKGVPIDTGFGNTLFYDTFTDKWILTSYQKIMSVVNDINNLYTTEGTLSTVGDWCIKNGYTPSELLWDYYFDGVIRLVHDGDHLYQADDMGNPFGIIEFMDRPKHLSKELKEGLPFL